MGHIMRIDEIQIEKFRTFKKCNIRLNDINAIVGENNSGKTAILKALNAFFHFEEESNNFVSHAHQYTKSANTKIQITFSDIPSKVFYDDKKTGDKLIVKMQYIYSKQRRTLTYIVNGTEMSCDDSFVQEIKKDIDYIYIPASRNNYDLKWKDDSVFKNLVEEYTKEYTTSRDMISKHVKSASEKLHKSVLNKIETQLEQLFPLDTKMIFSIGYAKDVDYSLLLENLVVTLNESGKEYPITEYGSGIKSLTVISMYRILASMTGRNIILGIEEPEMNLHPQMQKQFISAMKQGKTNNEVQLLMASHSTVIIDELNYDDIILVRREPDIKRGFTSIVTQLSLDFWNQNKEKFKYHQFFDYRNSDFYFSKYIIITESKTDAQVVEQLISNELGNKMSYVSIINLDGIKNLEYPFYLLKELKLPFSCVVDRDFFTEYLNGELDKSRDLITGFPKYKSEIVDSDLIKEILPTVEEREKLREAFDSGIYKNVYECLEKHKFYCMQYCLEMDMVCSSKICEKYYDLLNMTPDKHNAYNLLIEKKKAIKKIEYILTALDEVPLISYPISLKKIKRGLIDDVNEYV